MLRNRVLSFAFFALLAAPAVLAQPGTPAPGGGPSGHFKDKEMPMRGGMEGGGMGIVPPGTWWRSPATVASLTLTADQQKKLDELFLQSRINLIHLHAALEEEQLKLEPLLNSNPPDQTKTLAEISKIADLRAELEKADARMLLSLRGVLTADQWTKLQAEQHARHDDRHDDRRGPKAGPGGAQGRGQGQGRGPQPSGPGAPPPPPAGPTNQ